MLVFFRIGWWGVWIMKVQKRAVPHPYVIQNGQHFGQFGCVIQTAVKLPVSPDGVRPTPLLLGADQLFMNDLNPIYVGFGNARCGMFSRKSLQKKPHGAKLNILFGSHVSDDDGFASLHFQRARPHQLHQSLAYRRFGNIHCRC
ncbi:hypothetical protein DK59_3086 [Brucella abortus bv. 4 str. 292]|nr:hypothetical protein DK59_3086 [Brucella abortus bv. 4 str. 292]